MIYINDTSRHRAAFTTKKGTYSAIDNPTNRGSAPVSARQTSSRGKVPLRSSHKSSAIKRSVPPIRSAHVRAEGGWGPGVGGRVMEERSLTPPGRLSATPATSRTSLTLLWLIPTFTFY